MGINAVHGLKLLQETGRCFWTDTRNTCNIVHAVSDEAQPVHDLGGGHAGFFTDLPFFPNDFGFVVGIEQAHSEGNELQKIFVRTGNDDVQARPGRLPRDGGDPIIRFNSGLAIGRDSGRPQILSNAVDLLFQIIRHGGSVDLIRGQCSDAFDRQSAIPDGQQMRGPHIILHLGKRFNKAIDRIGGFSPRRSQLADRKKRSVRIRVSVHNQQFAC